MEEELKKGESAEALTVEGQKPDAVIPYEENGKKWYFWYLDRKSTRLNSSHRSQSRMPSSA